MLVCAMCGKVLRECCDLFYEATDEDGKECVLCGECAEKPDVAGAAPPRWTEMVREFNAASDAGPLTQMALVREEFGELEEAVAAGNAVAALDAICDEIYVLIGLALKMGFDLEGAFAEVHRSNMTKLTDGRLLTRPDGKILKPPSYSPPELDRFAGGLK